MKIFSSGSCRLVITINNGYDKVFPIHSMFSNSIGLNFLGKLYNTKQHIQFIKFIKDEIIIPDDILPKFLSSYKGMHRSEHKKFLSLQKDNIKEQFYECEWYLFEICSLKIYKHNGFDILFEPANEDKYILQTEEELLEDLQVIRQLLPSNKKILFQVHFRPNIIYNDDNKTIEKREVLYNLINKFCEKTENTFIYDPSILIQTNHSLFDGDVHFTDNGYMESFNYIYNNYFIRHM